MKPLRAKLIMEFLGTFGLVGAVVGAVIQDVPLAAIGIGGALLALVYAGGHISGAHYNPAVSIAATVRGALPVAELGPYILAQVLGAATAAGVAHWVFEGPSVAPAAWSGHALYSALVVETIWTFFLAFVILNVATSKDHPNNSFYGLAIGTTVAAGIVGVGAVSGAAFNPAVALGVSIADLSPWGNMWVFLVSQVTGGILGGLAFKLVNPDD